VSAKVAPASPDAAAPVLRIVSELWTSRLWTFRLGCRVFCFAHVSLTSTRARTTKGAGTRIFSKLRKIADLTGPGLPHRRPLTEYTRGKSTRSGDSGGPRKNGFTSLCLREIGVEIESESTARAGTDAWDGVPRIFLRPGQRPKTANLGAPD
jgi:hypothetical protein